MLTLGFIGLGMVVLSFLGALANMFFMQKSFHESMDNSIEHHGFLKVATKGVGFHAFAMGVMFIGMLLLVIGFAPSAWNLLLTLIQEIKK